MYRYTMGEELLRRVETPHGHWTQGTVASIREESGDTGHYGIIDGMSAI